MANYLYNGIELPELPEWDKEKYPYAYISVEVEALVGGNFIRGLYYSTSPFFVKATGAIGTAMGEEGETLSALISNYIPEWGELRGSDGDLNSYLPAWTNTDIYYEDGVTLYLKASDPIPVGGTSAPIDPTSMLMGWTVGRRIAGQRGKHPIIPVEYIRFDGTQYIDTGIICTQDTTIEAEFMRDNKTSYYLYGATSDGNTASVTAYLTSGSGNWRFGGTSVGQTISEDTQYTTKADKSGVTRNGTLSKYSGTVGTFATPQTLALGCNHSESGTFGTTRFQGRVYAFRIYQNGKPVLNYIPVSREGVQGFLDGVSGRFVPLEG